MTDLEMIKRCAEAMEPRPDLPGQSKIWGVTIDYLPEKKITHWVRGGYDPIHDDAQAMALVKKFPIECAEAIHAEAQRWSAETRYQADLNRAIVECVSRLP